MVSSHWNSTAQIISELRLRAKENDTDAILSELKEKRASLHPDKNGGGFANARDEATYHSIDEAISFVERLCGQGVETAIVRSDQLREIVAAAVEKALAATGGEALPEDIRLTADARAEIRHHYGLRKLTSGVVGAIFLGLIAFEGRLRDDPLFGGLVHSVVAKALLWVLLVISGATFLVLWLHEREEKLRAEQLETDGSLRKSFGSFCFSLTYDPRSQESLVLKFTKLQYADSLREEQGNSWEVSRHWKGLLRGAGKNNKNNQGHGRVWHLMRLIPMLPNVLLPRCSLSPVLSERLASVHLRRLLGRKVIAKGHSISLDETYEINWHVAEQISNERHRYPF